MSHRIRKIAQAWLESPLQGVVELVKDWRYRDKPDLVLSGKQPFVSLERLPDVELARSFGCFSGSAGELFFVVFPDAHEGLDLKKDRLFVAGDFSGWQAAVGNPAFEMHPACLGAEPVFVWVAPKEFASSFHGNRFKFVTADGRWLTVSYDCPNAVRDEGGNVNHLIDAERSGLHLFRFRLTVPLDLSKDWRVEWQHEGEGVHLRPDGFFYALRSDLPMGAQVRDGETIFRLFAPRAHRVELYIMPSLEKDAELLHYSLHRRAEPVDRLRTSLAEYLHPQPRGSKAQPIPGNWQGAWEITLDQDLHGWYYWYQVDGPSGPFSLFHRSRRVLDPYAPATVGREGPGIILQKERIAPPHDAFKTPPWQDLVIAEAHVRDLAQHAPVKLSDAERRGFVGLKKWVESPDFYLHRLGVNCVELQPVHEYDSHTREEYAWGYMPVSWFAPATGYSLDPATGSGVKELQELVAAFHRRGMAVVLDVVFNHQGDPSHLMFLDKHYYFMADGAGRLSNWSGCGNDFRASSAMARRLIIDSCIHMIQTYHIDGFRFDLAELLGVDVLKDIEKALKLVKQDVILIAEPWSFRGHVAGQLAETGWASWNDGYRNFLRDYLRGGSSSAQLEYFLKGSPWYFARWPAQTVNYTESHDDRTWIDMITEHGSGNGFHPTELDRRRTHLMAAVLFASLGIPMLSAGQDFLRSKHGVNNTYLRGDLNALDYRRVHRYSGTHAYFAEWIAFRLSPQGHLLRQWSCPSEGFFRSFTRPDSTVMALLYNADSTRGPDRLLFAINPTHEDKAIAIDPEVAVLPWRQLADHERFYPQGMKGVVQHVTPELVLPAFSCALWKC